MSKRRLMHLLTAAVVIMAWLGLNTMQCQEISGSVSGQVNWTAPYPCTIWPPDTCAMVYISKMDYAALNIVKAQFLTCLGDAEGCYFRFEDLPQGRYIVGLETFDPHIDKTQVLRSSRTLIQYYSGGSTTIRIGEIPASVIEVTSGHKEVTGVDFNVTSGVMLAK